MLRVLPWMLMALMAAPAWAADALAWPSRTAPETRPWAYWWWMGSAVDEANLTRELTRYRDAGMGGVHIIPIYGAKGFESRYIEYLGPRWMELLAHTVKEARRLGLDIDMTTGTGWCFGGPTITARDANAVVVAKTFDVRAGGKIAGRLDRANLQRLVAFGPSGKSVDLTRRVGADGLVDWTAEAGDWRVYAISQRPTMRVKRAAPGGEGYMLNPLHAPSMTLYLERFTKAFAEYKGPRPRAMYHDSFEYNANWSPSLFEEFERRRGYRLEDELRALFEDMGERSARVKCDYRETVSDIMVEASFPQWTAWARERGIQTRNQAHGSPGNLLDLYSLADIPETEMFNADRSTLVSKLASSAAHVNGKRLVASETGTWLKEHFNETLADLKQLIDQLFIAGVNHVVYHGTAYSPDEAPWPGWLFYASTEMNPRNSMWRDAPALNAYISRAQSMLQGGHADNDVLLYWPIHDLWQNGKGMAENLTVHHRAWLEEQQLGRTAHKLLARGYSFDFVSDRQLLSAVKPGAYRAIVVPKCRLMPVRTLGRLLALARGGTKVIFEDAMPEDVPGLGDLDRRRVQFRGLLNEARGVVAVGEVESALAAAGVTRESMVDTAGVEFIRRATGNGTHVYFIVNRGATLVDTPVKLARAAKSVGVMDPMTGAVGMAGNLRLRLEPGASIILRTFATATAGPAWKWMEPAGNAVPVAGPWKVEFIAGGPEMPAPAVLATLASWTAAGDAKAVAFAGTARYTASFDAPAGPRRSWAIDLGRVAESARVRLNGRDLGTVFQAPFLVAAGALQPRGNTLEVEVTNLAANRIRDLDIRKVAWKTFRDINIVGQDYKPLDASQWPVRDSGLLGPVTLRELR